MSLELEHQKAIEDKSYFLNKVSKMYDAINNDNSGACWDIVNTKKYTEKQFSILNSIPIDELNQMPLYGITTGVKDLFCINGLRTTAGSMILKDFIAPYDSTVYSTLQDNGVLLGGKLAMDEFAMGSFTNTSKLGKVTIEDDYTAGGSSGGSAAALKNKLFDFTVGSDTGGSVRQPASFCSVVGYKPSYGAFSRYGMIQYASSLDQAGFFTDTIDDLNWLLQQNIANKDIKDPTHIGLGQYNSVNKKSLTVAVFPHLFDEALSDEVKSAYQSTINRLKQTVNVIEVDIPLMRLSAQLYYIIACAEASSNLARYQGIYYGGQLINNSYEGTFWEQTAQFRSQYFGKEVQKRIMLGSYLLSSENFNTIYNKAKALRSTLSLQLNEVLSKVDCLVLPTAPYTAPKWSEINEMTTAQIYMADFLTVPFSLAGLPVVSMPEHKHNGLGIGIQYVGKRLQDYQLITDVMKLGVHV